MFRYYLRSRVIYLALKITGLNKAGQHFILYMILAHDRSRHFIISTTEKNMVYHNYK